MGRRPFKWQFAFRRRFWVNRCFFPTHCQIDQQIIVNWLEHAHIIIIRFRIDFLLILRFFVFLLNLWLRFGESFVRVTSTRLDWIDCQLFPFFLLLLLFLSFQLDYFPFVIFNCVSSSFFILNFLRSVYFVVLYQRLSLSLRPICCCWQTSTLPLIWLICVLVWYVNLLYWHFNQRTPLNDEIALLMRSLFFGNRNQSRINNTKHQQ